MAEVLALRLERAAAAFRARFGAPPAWLGWAPGRVNLIGEHTDYNEGLALPAAIDRWVVVALSFTPEARIQVRAEDYGADLDLPLGSPPPADLLTTIMRVPRAISSLVDHAPQAHAPLGRGARRSGGPPRGKPAAGAAVPAGQAQPCGASAVPVGGSPPPRAALPREKGQRGRSDHFGLRAEPHAEQPSWERFTLGCLAEFPAPLPGGIRAVVAGDVPLGAGLSSSAAVELAWLNALRAATGAPLSDLDLCRAGQRVEHRHLGLASGLLDQLASQFSRAGHVLSIDFSDLSWRAVPLSLPGWTWAVLDSGVRRELAGSGYRERVAECAHGLALARAIDPTVRSFRDLTAAHLAALPEAQPARRLGHVLAENARVRAMEQALAAGEGDAAGALLSASHRSLRDAYAVSCSALDLLADLAEAEPACAGARMVGGGFGGCVLALLREEAWEGFAARVLPAYEARSGHAARAWRFSLVAGAGGAPAAE